MQWMQDAKDAMDAGCRIRPCFAAWWPLYRGAGGYIYIYIYIYIHVYIYIYSYIYREREREREREN